jgi:hypothetical protein
MSRLEIVKKRVSSVRGSMVEVGVHEGDFSRFLLRNTQGTTLYCVDPYKKFEEGVYKDAMNDKSQADFDRMYEGVASSLSAEFSSRVAMVRKLSTDALPFFPNKSLAFVYIDGNHGFSHVLADIEAWLPKIQTGGILAGDDVCDYDETKRDADGNVRMDWSPGCYGYYGVYKALCVAKEKFGIQFTIEGTQFFIQC